MPDHSNLLLFLLVNMTFFWDHLALIPVIAFFASVAVKGMVLAHLKTFNVKNMFGSGGMPSVHSSLVTSLTTAIGIKWGVGSDIFLVCLVFACIIIYDAINVRFEAGQHAKALNSLANSGEDWDFNENIGHLPREAFIGSCIGILTAILLLSF